MAGPEETKPGSEARQPVLACATEQPARAQPASSSRHPARAPRAIALCSTIVPASWQWEAVTRARRETPVNLAGIGSMRSE